MVKYQYLITSAVVAAIMFSCNQNTNSESRKSKLKKAAIKAIINETDMLQDDLKGRVKLYADTLYQFDDAAGTPQNASFRTFSECTFDTNGFITHKVTRSTGGYNSDINYIYLLDVQGNCTGRLGPLGTQAYKYDDKGNLIEVSNYAGPKNISMKLQILYNAAGQETETRSYSADGVLKRTRKVKYNDAGKRTELLVISSGKDSDTLFYKYDSNGKYIGCSSRPLYGADSACEFDKSGNWTKQIILVKQGQKEEPIYITKRHITYY